MDFILNKDSVICIDERDWPGVKRVADKVAGDFELVFGASNMVSVNAFTGDLSHCAGKIIAGCLGRSEVIDELSSKGIIDTSEIKEKREIYLFTIAKIDEKETLVIAGSDKRGTIYGLFHISELMGVSPWVWFADVLPVKKEKVVLTENDTIVSKEPSVRYRGFFINDEWPSFGTWTNNLFGGFNAKVYDRVFELLLRMHGNYLWPAMWTSCFSEDGPGIESARLADEYGVVMGTSHHEPCMRHGEEFSHVKGPDSVYGNDWNFNRNREGLINFWRDGLKRNAPFENIVTIGMRGEADSEMLGRECTVLDNINYLKDVITTQHDLLNEVYGEKVSEVDTVFAVYKEVEKFYYGDEENEGLRTWEGLDGTIILLSDDNFGNMRLLPPKEDRGHKGGFGMYYHVDYHGAPISYEWVNSTYIPRIAEQMGQAWDCSVRDLWIVNVGDIKPCELPLNYFMDLAYDYDKWSKEYASYTAYWAEKQFAGEDAQTVADITDVLDDYTRINSVRRPESIHPDTYSPYYFGEAEKMLEKAVDVIDKACDLKERLQESDLYDAFYQLVFFPARASMNVLIMQLYSGYNSLFAERGCPFANRIADLIAEDLKMDEELTEEYNSLTNGKWNGMMLSEHIGFIHWNEEEHRLPVRTYVESYERARVCVSVSGLPGYTYGCDWTRRELLMADLLVPDASGEIRIENCCRKEADWKAECDSDWIVLDLNEGHLGGAAKDNVACDDSVISQISMVSVSADKQKLHKACEENGVKDISGTITVLSGPCKAEIKVWARDFSDEESSAVNYVPFIPDDVRIPKGGIALGCAIEAGDHEKLNPGKECAFKEYAPYGKYHSGLGTLPADASGDPKDMPSADYKVYLPEEGEYELTLCTAPGGPVFKDTFSSMAFSVNDGDIVKVKMVSDTYRAGDTGCEEWCTVALMQEKKQSVCFIGKKGENRIRIYACDPGAVLMRIIVRHAKGEMPVSHFGVIPEFILNHDNNFGG